MVKDPKRFLEHLIEVGVAFAPKTQSNSRQLGLKMRPDADDDGVAILWRADKFELSKLDFLAMDDKKRNQGAVRATLTRKADDAPIVVICAHLSSGTERKDEEIRMKEVRT